jgi:hypothetical protein
MFKSRAAGWLVGILWAASGYGAPVEDAPFALDVAPAGAQPETTLSVPRDGRIDVTLIRAKPNEAVKPIDLILSPFRDEQGNAIAVEMALPAEPDRPKGQKLAGVRPEASCLTVRLHVPDFPPAAKYKGRLTLVAPGAAPMVWPIRLGRSGPYRPATLVLDRTTIALQITKSFWPRSGAEEAACSVVLREKSGTWGLDGVTARLEQAAKAPPAGFDLERNVRFTFNGAPVSRFSSWPPAETPPPGESREAASRSIPPEGQATVRLAFRRLQAGDYNVTLRFHAANAADDDAQRLTITLQVRHAIGWAILLMVVALGLSFAATKGITILRQRAALRKRIVELHDAWLQSEPQVVPVVLARALLQQVEDLSRSWWLSAPEEIDARIDRVATLLAVLDRVRLARQEIGRAVVPSLLRARMLAQLDRIVARLGDSPLDESCRKKATADVEELLAWLKQGKVEDAYWRDLKISIAWILNDVRLDAFDDPDARAEIDRLRKILEAGRDRQPADLPALVSLEEDFARLRIAWERRRAAEFPDLLALLRQQAPIERLFQFADDRAWERLRGAAERGQIRIQCLNTGAPEAYDSIRFAVITGDPALDASYLFLHGLDFEWSFRLDDATPLTPTTREPKVVHYATKAGTLHVSVCIRRGSQLLQVGPAIDKPIARSREFAWIRGFKTAEVASTCVSALFALVTGLATYYYKIATFGSPQDYLSLFLWGAGVDQTKNFLQSLQAYASGKDKSR